MQQQEQNNNREDDDGTAFVYTGQPREEIPNDVRIIHVDVNVRELPNKVFYRCNYLEQVHLPQSGLKTIPEAAFRYCNNLRRIQIPSTVTSIGKHAFHRCRSLEELSFDDKRLDRGYLKSARN